MLRRAVLWLSPDYSKVEVEGKPKVVIDVRGEPLITHYAVDGMGKVDMPSQENDSDRHLSNWFSLNWRFAPFTYLTTRADTTVIVLEKDDEK